MALLNTMHWLTLSRIANGTWTRPSLMGVGYRKVAIELAAENPPLVVIDGDVVAVTEAGRAALSHRRTAP